MPPTLPEAPEFESSVNIQAFVLFLLAITFGLLAAVLILPAWMPNLFFSLTGSAPKAYWYLSRATAFVSLSLLWISMALGIGISNKMARAWPGAPAAFAVHEYTSLLGLAFALFHALVLLGDRYINFTLAQILMPFSTEAYRPLWVGIGQLGFYLWIIVAFSFYVRGVIGQKTWRLVHYASFLMYIMGLAHGLLSGTDSGAGWAAWYYWISAGSILFLFVTRLVGALVGRLTPERPRPAPASRPVPQTQPGD